MAAGSRLPPVSGTRRNAFETESGGLGTNDPSWFWRGRLKISAMSNVSDAFLLEVAGISASLLGFFVVGVFFYAERSIFPQAADEAHRYLKAAVRSVIYLYGMATLVALGLVVLSPGFVAVLYALLSAGLVWSALHTSAATRRLQHAVGVRVLSQTSTWIATTLIAVLPWVIGGGVPGRSDLAWGLTLVAVCAFASTASFVLSAFDLSFLEASALPSPEEREDSQHAAGEGVSDVAEEIDTLTTHSIRVKGNAHDRA